MYTMRIPRTAVDGAIYAHIGRLAVDHRATVLVDPDNVTIEFRPVRINGADISGDSRAYDARVVLTLLEAVASDFSPVPEPVIEED